MIYTDKNTYIHISKQNDDPIIERRTCRLSWTPFPVFESDKKFYEKIWVPFPTLCPEERQRRRLLFRNERKLYRRQCDATKQSIISIYSPDKDIPVYDNKVRWSDSRDALSYGRDVDFSQTFTEQFGQLMKVVPRYALSNDNGVGSENCDYCQDIMTSYNCYLCTWSLNLRNSLFTTNSEDADGLVDCFNVLGGEHSYECIDCTNVFGCISCVQCHDCSFCINCTGLRGKQYHINNIAYTKDDFEQKKRELLAQWELIHANNNISDTVSTVINSEQSFGANLYGCHRCVFCYDFKNGNNCSYCNVSDSPTDCYDIDISWRATKQLETLTCDYSTNVLFSLFTISSSDSLYCQDCFQVKNCFGCISLRNKEYCIFNKQYTKDEYEQLLPKIINHMRETEERGEFFNPSLSLFGYNETVAYEYYPLTQWEAINKWYTRQENNYDPQIPDSATIHNWSSNWTFGIDNHDDQTILSTIFLCNTTQRPYRLVKAEVDFYRKQWLPLPRLHPDQRHARRFTHHPERVVQTK